MTCVAVAQVAVYYILQVWCWCCRFSGGTQNFYVSRVEHIALVSREHCLGGHNLAKLGWQVGWPAVWKPLISTQHDGHCKEYPFRWCWQMQWRIMLPGYLGQWCLKIDRFAGCRISHCGKLCEHLKTLRFGSLNLGTIRKMEGEVVETLTRRWINHCAVCYCGICKTQNRMLTGKDSCYRVLLDRQQRERAVQASYWLNAGWQIYL